MSDYMQQMIASRPEASSDEALEADPSSVPALPPSAVVSQQQYYPSSVPALPHFAVVSQQQYYPSSVLALPPSAQASQQHAVP